MFEVLIAIEDQLYRARSMHAVGRVGEPWSLRLEVLLTAPIDPEQILGKAAAVRYGTPEDEHVVHGLVMEARARATAQAPETRRMSVHIESSFAVLRLRRRSHVFQHLSISDIVQRVLEGGGIPSDQLVRELGDAHPEREYVTQYNETDWDFLRRLCEDEGLLFRCDPRDDHDRFVLADSSGSAPPALDEPIPILDAAGLREGGVMAWDVTVTRKRRPGKVTLRDHDPRVPAAPLESKASAGVAEEAAGEVYAAPGHFNATAEGDRRARLRLESLRAEATIVEFSTTAFGLRPGTLVHLDGSSATGTATPDGDYFISQVELRTDASSASSPFTMRVWATPKDTPYRLARSTPLPKIAGVHSAIMTGAAGEEIHVTGEGRGRVHFHWDREGPVDDKSSLPIRLMQANMPGSMLIPRVGWEVLVGFDDGDPDRPYVLGRPYNAKQPPPFPLPANKTMSSLQTISSPGGGGVNSVNIDDAAGRQHMVWSAAFAKTTDVAAKMLTQTVGFEKVGIGGSQTWGISGKQTVSIGNAYLASLGSQSETIGATHDVLVKAVGSTSVGSASVAVGAALIEQVGDPATGLANFAKAAALAGVGNIPVVGSALVKGYSVGSALGKAYQSGGVEGLATAAGQLAVGEIAGKFNADAIVAAADGAGLTPWSDKAQAAKGAEQAGGGTGGAASQGAAAAAAAPGHRKTIVDGAMSETIGGLYSVTTPGSIKWTTMGASTFLIGGTHATRAVKVSTSTRGASSETSATVKIAAGKSISRTVKAMNRLTVGGGLTSEAGGPLEVVSDPQVKITAGGAMNVEGGSVIFMVGGSYVIVHGGGMVAAASTVTVNGQVKHSAKEDIG